MTRPVVHRWVANRWMALALCLIAAVLFFVANRAAYKGYFSDDDLADMGWPKLIENEVFLEAIVTPQFSTNNFRPVGSLYYRYLANAFHLYYPPYVAVLQAFHVLNVILLFFVLRRLDFSQFAAAIGAVFYAFHAAVLEAFWKPMYIFEVLCCTLCLLALYLYVRGHWILALVPFWLAYKSKEIAVMLPVALLAYELFLGGRKWKRLIPYFLISLSFGLQALWYNRSVAWNSTYRLHFSLKVLWECIAFYSSAILFLPFAGLALLLLPIAVRDRRLYLGLIFIAALFVPMLALPARLVSVYWYIPMIGLAIVVAAIASRMPRWAIALFFVFWFPLNYAFMREKRREILALADENRWYVAGLQNFARHVPPLKAVVYQGIPEHMRPWGLEGAIHEVFGYHVDPVWFNAPRAQQALAEVPMAIVGYYPAQHIVKGLLRERNELASYIRFTEEVPRFQFGEGWHDIEDACRWTGPKAELVLSRPSEAKEFEIVGSVPGTSQVTVFEDGRSLGTQVLTGTTVQRLHWELPAGPSGEKKITIQNSRDLGIAVRAIGYLPP